MRGLLTADLGPTDASPPGSAVPSFMVKGEVLPGKTSFQKSAKGPISLSDCAADGKSITIENTGRKVEPQSVTVEYDKEHVNKGIFIFPMSPIFCQSRSCRFFWEVRESFLFRAETETTLLNRSLLVLDYTKEISFNISILRSFVFHNRAFFPSNCSRCYLIFRTVHDELTLEQTPIFRDRRLYCQLSSFHVSSILPTVLYTESSNT